MTAVKDELSELKTLVKEQYLTQKLNQLVPPAYTSSYNEKIYSATPKPTKHHINLQSSRQFNSYATQRRQPPPLLVEDLERTPSVLSGSRSIF